LSSKKPLEEYFSSGVLVFNLKNTNLIEKRRELDKLLPNNYFSHDQDILNLLFSEDETYELPRAWNYFNSAPTLQFKDFIDRKERENYLEGKVKPKIVSYVLKPWLKENFNAPFAEEYWDELRNSPYYEKVKRSSLKNGKIARFLKLNLKEKVVFLTSRELLIKIFKRINN
jgi:lipopolysaccharide biosynthesis glycosyltransferase